MPHKPLEEIARRWVPGEGPVELRLPSFGLVNQTCQVVRAGRAYSLRVTHREPPLDGSPDPEPASALDPASGGARDPARARGFELGVDRRWECRVLATASAAGIAPPVHRCEPAEGILVADWVPGRTWSTAETREPGNIDTMAQLLRRVHALPIPQPARIMNPAAWIAHYSAALERIDGSAAPLHPQLRLAADHRLKRLASTAAAPVLCHSDVHRHNVAIGERPVLIDWEYAHVSEPFWDLAGWVSNNDGSRRFSAELLASYLRRSALPEESGRLVIMTWLYDYVCLLWNELLLRLRPRGVADAQARARQLEERLAMPGGRAGQDPAH